MTGGNGIVRVPTGISGFDDVAMGGLPARRCTLVSGTTGSGKTLFAVEFLARGITRFAELGVFVTFEEEPGHIQRNAVSLGFDIERWQDERKWVFVDASVTTEDVPTVGGYDFGALLARIEHAVKKIGARRVALDSLGAILTRLPDIDIVRHETFRIATALEALGVTTVVTAERPEEYDGVTRYGFEEFVLDNVIILRNVLGRERRRRTLEIVKCRGVPHRTGEWLFTIDSRDGIVVVPFAFLKPREAASVDRVSSGNAELDEMCGGGVFKDAVVLVTGPTGTGKTLLSLRFAAAAVAAGERCLLYTFDETREQLLRNGAGWNMDLVAMEESGLLRIIANYPEVASLEDHFLQIKGAIADFAPDRLVIDTLSALERIVPPRPLFNFVIALGSVLRQQEITTLLTSEPTGRIAPSTTPPIAMEIASLTDVSILLRYVERAGEIRRALVVLQTRGSAHDQSIREFTIDSAGMHIGEPLTSVSHLLGESVVLPEGLFESGPDSSGPATG